VIKEVRFIDWKSFEDSTLYIDPLTILIGTNASGKSNALDALLFLHDTVSGNNIHSSLVGEKTLLLEGKINGIRGGVEWAARFPKTQFTLEALVADQESDYRFSIQVQTHPTVEIVSESLFRIKYNSGNKKSYKTKLYEARVQQSDSPSITVFLNNGQGRPIKQEFKRSVSVISQMKNQKIRKEIDSAVLAVSTALENIFILDPVPSLMRDYKTLSSSLATNASNLAGMLAALTPPMKSRIEDRLSKYLSKLPEGDIKKVWVETVGRFQSDAMLYCEENWSTNSEPLIMDARGMSDGTLRFLGILTALLTRPQDSLIVIEEVDNGLHPSRAKYLLELLIEIGRERKIDILITTHNPALMDELGPEMVPFVITSHRDSFTGASNLTMLEDVNNLAKLLASGPIGHISTKGYIEQSLSVREENSNGE
jgi:AAA15 family ATPase/GTPase